MTPEGFLTEIVQPNVQEALERPDDLRAIINAIMTLDALSGILHCDGVASGRAEMDAHASDDKYREALAHISPSFRLLRDVAASLKHGELTHSRSQSLPRLVSRSDSMQVVPAGMGLFQMGDRLQSEAIVIEFDPGPGYQRASNVIANSCRMLKRIAEGKPARIDENG